MGTDTRTALDQPSMTAPTPKPPRDKVMRIATMTKPRHRIAPALSVSEPSTPTSSTSCTPTSPPTYATNCNGLPCRSPATPNCPTLNCASPTLN